MPKARGGIWCGCPTCGPSRLHIPVGRNAVQWCGAWWDSAHLKAYKEQRRERTTGGSLPDFTRWTPAGQERALEELNRSNLDSWKPFYCPRSGCDGNHHLSTADPVCEEYPDRPPRLHDWAQTALGVWACQYEGCDATGQPDDKWVFRHARADQHPPSDKDWLIWLLLAGRGAGKTRAGSEWVHRLAAKYPGCHIALISPTRTDVRDTQVEGESESSPPPAPGWPPSGSRPRCG